MSRHFQPVILYNDERSYNLPIEKKQQIHDMLRMNGRLWTALLTSPIRINKRDSLSAPATTINKDCWRRHLNHKRTSSQDSILSSLPSNETSQCHTPLQIDDIPLDYHSPYINEDEDDADGDNDSGVDKEANNKITAKKSRKRKSSIFNHHQSLAPTSPVLSSSSSISSSSSPPLTPVISTATRKRRGNLPKTITCLLKEWLILHADHPYPSDDEKLHLQQETNLTINQISNWFINARRRLLPYLINGTHPIASTTTTTTTTTTIQHHYQHPAQQKGSSVKRKQETRKHTVAQKSTTKKSSGGSGMIKKHAPPRQLPSRRPKRTCRSHQSSSLLGKGSDEWVE